MPDIFDIIACPQCRSPEWSGTGSAKTCARCNYTTSVNGRFINLLPDELSANNAREAAVFGHSDQVAQEYMVSKPYHFPRLLLEEQISICKEIGAVDDGLGLFAKVLFVFAGGGMEAHLSGLLGENTVLADISMPSLEMAQARFAHYQVREPGAYVACDAERLPFKTDSFDYVIAFEGIHHCLIPQAALTEVWRVSKRFVFVVDNYECGLTRLLSLFGKSSQIEYSGVKPNRFSRNELQTLMHNARVQEISFRPRAVLPEGICRRAGYWLAKAATSLLNLTRQTNTFVLVTEKISSQAAAQDFIAALPDIAGISTSRGVVPMDELKDKPLKMQVVKVKDRLPH